MEPKAGVPNAGDGLAGLLASFGVVEDDPELNAEVDEPDPKAPVPELKVEVPEPNAEPEPPNAPKPEAGLMTLDALPLSSALVESKADVG